MQPLDVVKQYRGLPERAVAPPPSGAEAQAAAVAPAVAAGAEAARNVLWPGPSGGAAGSCPHHAQPHCTSPPPAVLQEMMMIHRSGSRC